MSRITARPRVDLPEPDSPLSPKRSPEPSCKLTPSTAVNGPRGVGNYTCRSEISRIGGRTGGVKPVTLLGPDSILELDRGRVVGDDDAVAVREMEMGRADVDVPAPVLETHL